MTFQMFSSKKFKVGEVYKVYPTQRSHEKSPYYVEITIVENRFVTTNIPAYNSRTVQIGTFEYRYLTDRMEYVGLASNSETRALLYNQELKRL
jgi:hypothetical protein